MADKNFVFDWEVKLNWKSLGVLCFVGVGAWALWPSGDDDFVGVYEGEMREGMAVMDRMPMMAKSAVQNFSSGASGVASRFAPETVMADDGVAGDQADRKIVKNATLNLEVGNTEEGKSLAKAEVKSLGGFVTNQNSWEVRPRVLAYNMTVRVPAENLEKLVKNLETIGVKKSENYSTSDITAQYADTEAEIEILEASRDTLTALMEKKSENLGDYLKIYQELTKVQKQIDRLTRMQKKRDEQVTYSTLRLTINPEPQIGDISSPEWNTEKSWKLAVNDLLKFAQGMTDKLIYVVVFSPVWIAVLILVWIVRWVFRRKKQD